MGSSSSTRRRNDQVPPPRPFPPPIATSSSSILLLPQPPAPPPTPPPPPPPPSSHDANYPAPPLPPPPLPSYVFAANTPYAPPYAPNYPNYSHYSRFSGGYSLPYAASGQSGHPFYMNPRGVCPYPQPVPSYPGPPLRPPPPYVDHNKATTIRNDVNLRKDTIRLEVDEQNPDHHLVTFTFDSTVDGSFTIFYMAKEGEECTFDSQEPEVYKPVKVPFQKGVGQKFCQSSGTGIDLGFFALDDLNKPSPDEVYPLVISAEACSVPSGTKPHSQITLSVIEKKESEQFLVKVIKQILWIDGVRYELQEIYGIGSSSTSDFDDDAGKECVICMSERRNTAVMPCRHMCMCSECAEILRHQSNRCPICRNPVEQLMEIKV
ncbi:putative E3 ubiquitin-protein ligase [Nymphaea thermarum]|nr:putative E3 ubiquitin-protein ligase [Nymphaea thermarum]